MGCTSLKDGLGYSEDLIKGSTMQFADYLSKDEFFWIESIIELLSEVGMSIDNVYRDEN